MPAPFRTVVVGIDGRDGGRDAVALARALSPAGRHILVVAIPFESAGLSANATRLLEHERDRTGAAGARLLVVTDGSPARGLHRVAEQLGADLLVVGSCHHSRFGRALLGDVGRGVVRHAPCPVAVAPRAYQPAPPATVGVAYDGSPESAEALRLGRALADAPDRRLRLYVVAHLPEMARTYVYPHDWEHRRSAARVEAERVLTRALVDIGPNCGGEVLSGDAATLLAAATRDVDVMLVGSRGWGPVRRVMSGSTSDHLLHHAACPVIVAARAAVEAQAAHEPATRAAAPA